MNGRPREPTHGIASAASDFYKKQHLTTLAKPGAIEEAAEAAAILPELHSAEVVVAGPLASIFSV